MWEALHLSGEPEVFEINGLFEADGPREPLSLLKYQDTVGHMKDYRNRYQEYWMSTAQKTGNGKPVDVFISPVTVTAGLLPDKFFYGGMYTHPSGRPCDTFAVSDLDSLPGYLNCVNVLDLPAVVVPILFADENVDKRDESFQPLSDMDKVNMEACKSIGLLWTAPWKRANAG